MKFLILVILINSLSVKCSELCSKCVCMSKYFPGPYSFYFTDVHCTGTSTDKITFDLSTFENPNRVRDITISGYQHVTLNTESFWSNVEEDVKRFKRNILTENVSRVHLENWSNYCNYTFNNVSNISFKRYFDSSRTELDSLIINHSCIHKVRAGNMNFKSIRDQVIFNHVNLMIIHPKSMKFNMLTHSSTFTMLNTKIDNKSKRNSFEVIAAKILIAYSTFNGSSTYLKLNGTERVIIKKCTIIQYEENEFFDLYSPLIILKKNTILSQTEINKGARISG